MANGALLVSATPVAITLFSTVSGKERIGALHWAGTLLSLARDLHRGRARRARDRASLYGDLMLMGAVLCWALYTIGARPLMERHSPVGVTALSMLFGTMMYVPVTAGALSRVPWGAVSAITWVKLVYSALFSICVAYTIWYTAVRAIGSARTSVYSNLAADRRDGDGVRVAARADRADEDRRRGGRPGGRGPDPPGAGPAGPCSAVGPAWAAAHASRTGRHGRTMEGP